MAIPISESNLLVHQEELQVSRGKGIGSQHKPSKIHVACRHAKPMIKRISRPESGHKKCRRPQKRQKKTKKKLFDSFAFEERFLLFLQLNSVEEQKPAGRNKCLRIRKRPRKKTSSREINYSLILAASLTPALRFLPATSTYITLSCFESASSYVRYPTRNLYGSAYDC